MRPFKAFRDNFMNVLNEIFYVTFCSLCMVFVSEPSESIGRVLIYLITVNTTLISLITIFLFVFDVIKFIIKKITNKKVGNDDLEDMDNQPIDAGFENPTNIAMVKGNISHKL